MHATLKCIIFLHIFCNYSHVHNNHKSNDKVRIMRQTETTFIPRQEIFACFTAKINRFWWSDRSNWPLTLHQACLLANIKSVHLDVNIYFFPSLTYICHDDDVDIVVADVLLHNVKIAFLSILRPMLSKPNTPYDRFVVSTTFTTFPEVSIFLECFALLSFRKFLVFCKFCIFLSYHFLFCNIIIIMILLL